MATAGPTWYEILGVAADASPAEIKAAWRDATDKFEPGSGASQFRLFNEAADTLLDPEKRAAYDAELAGEKPVEDAEPDQTPADVEPVEAPAAEDVETPGDVEPVEAPAAEEEPEPAPEAPAVPKKTRSIPLLDPLARSTFGLALVGVLALIAVIAGVLVVVNIQGQRSDLDNGPGGKNGGLAAQAVAERGITAALSYDYRTIDADKETASSYVAPSFRKEFLATYELITQGSNGTPGGAIKLKATQTVDLLNSAVMSGSDDKDANILVYLNTTTAKTGTSPQVRAWRIVVKMQHTSGKWLIKGLDIY